MRFDCILNKYLKEYNASIIEGVVYEQYIIKQNKDLFYIEDDERLIWQGSSIKEAKEFINTVNSGC